MQDSLYNQVSQICPKFVDWPLRRSKSLKLGPRGWPLVVLAGFRRGGCGLTRGKARESAKAHHDLACCGG
jgi:hypothetical protein